MKARIKHVFCALMVEYTNICHMAARVLSFFFFCSENSTTISLIRTKVLINYIQSKLVCYYRAGVFHPNLRFNTTASCPSQNVCSIVTLSAYMAQRQKLKGTKSHSYTFHHLHNWTWPRLCPCGSTGTDALRR